MIIFPHAKINLGLRVTGKRSDGYHSIETVMVSLAWFDILEFVPAQEEEEETSLSVTGLEAGIPPRENLVYRAWKVLSEKHSLPPLKIHLHKNIPAGSGLGGGSADAAFMLRGLRDYFSIPLPEQDWVDLALSLGSDCPFFMYDTPCLARGRGEKLEPVDPGLDGYELMVVVPPVRISTARAYGLVTPAPAEDSLAERIREPVAEWKNHIVNDFEPVIFREVPVVKNIRDRLYEQGAMYASLSGSGSSVFGIFRQGEAPDQSDFAEMTCWKGGIKKPGKSPVS
ncbi:MAG TPA: 4-(cytidine 5'-diphospho)-2-C-methyl-D-erythritol kinase [Bacteroidetes bacterium]|nr:4-(cytidine 5'-diphospho)-2-C-methyl-D-erythritol kinase [Bacteroidota bacterium]